MPRPRSLTRAAIAEAALAVIEADGLRGLTMRGVAGELGVGTMSLYRYVEHREELESWVVDLVLATVDTNVSRRIGWKKRLATLAVRAHDAIEAHPEVVPLLLTRRHASDGSLRWGEAMLGALADGGFEGEERALSRSACS